MPLIAILFGAALEILGVVGFEATGARTALIPFYVGVVLFLLGLLAMKDSMRKHAMHFAAMIALLGTLAALGRLVPTLIKGGGTGWSLTSLTLMALLCAGFLALCVRSFIIARRNRERQGFEPVVPPPQA